MLVLLRKDQIGIHADLNTHKAQTIVAGGSSRAESVRNGLDAVSADTEIVAVHDGARPLVSVEEIERTIETAKQTGAACLVAARHGYHQIHPRRRDRCNA